MPDFYFNEKKLFCDIKNGIRAGFKHIKEENGEYKFSEKQDKISLDFCVRENGYEEFYLYSATKAHSDPLSSEVKVSLDADISLTGRSEFSIEFILSAQPPTYKQAKLIYCMGENLTDKKENTVRLPFPAKSEDGLYHFDLTNDTLDEIGGLDNALCYINLILRSENGNADVSFRGFKFDHKLNFEEVRQRQASIAQVLEKRWGVKAFITFEVSGAGHHKNCYTTSVPCIDYAALDYKVTEEDAIKHIADHGGIFCYNHPFTEWKRDSLSEDEKQKVVCTLIDKFAENKVLGATLMEVGFPYEKEDFYDRHYLSLYDGITSRGIFITAIGDSDNHHASESGWTKSNNFAVFAGLYEDEEPTEENIANAFKRRSVWCGNPVLIKNMSLFANDKFAFGSIFTGENLKVCFSANKISCNGYAIRIVNGKEDSRIPFRDGQVADSHTLLCNERYNFIRYELRDEDDVLIALSNPVYLVKSEEDIYSDAQIRRSSK